MVIRLDTILLLFLGPIFWSREISVKKSKSGRFLIFRPFFAPTHPNFFNLLSSQLKIGSSDRTLSLVANSNIILGSLHHLLEDLSYSCPIIIIIIDNTSIIHIVSAYCCPINRQPPVQECFHLIHIRPKGNCFIPKYGRPKDTNTIS